MWRHWLDGLAEGHTVVRYDERGSGLSDREPGDLSLDTWVDDLETVVDAAGLDRFALLGVSQGAAVAMAYAVRHPERLTHLVLYGGYARGRKFRQPEARRHEDALISAIRAGWSDPSPTFRHLFSTLFLPDGTPEQMAWYDDLQRRSASPGTAARLYDARGSLNVVDLAPRVTTKTLVMHAREDRVVPVEEGRLLGARIPGARLILLESANHILLADEPAWARLPVGAPCISRHGTRARTARRRRAQRPRAGGPGARGGGADQRGDRRAPVSQRPHRRAPSLEHLREAARLRQGRARGRRREVLPDAPSSPACRPSAAVSDDWVLTPMPARAEPRSVGPCRLSNVITPSLRSLRTTCRGRGATAPCAGMGQPQGARDPVRPRLVAEPAVLGASGHRSTRRAVPPRHVRPPRARHVRAAAGGRPLRRRRTLGR